MSTSKLLAQASAVAFVASFLTACGGGGGGGGGSGNGGNPPPPPPAPESRPLDRETAKRYAGAFIQLETLSYDAVYDAPNTIAYVIQSTKGQTIDDTMQCTSGSRRATGTIDRTNGTADITLSYHDCIDADPSATMYSDSYTGTIHITVRGISNGYPVGYDYRYENYQWRDLLTNRGQTYSGTTSIDKTDNGDLKFAASVTLTDEAGVSVTTSDYTAQFTIYDYGWGPYIYRVSAYGHMKHSALGTVRANASASSPDVYLTSNVSGMLRIDANSEPVHLSLDADGDGNYESFAYVPWDQFGSESVENTAPVVNFSIGYSPGIDQDIQVPIFGVMDAEFDFLTYSIATLQSPGNADLTPTVLEDTNISFRTAGPGDYVLALTVDDGRGGKTTRNLAFRVALPAPIVDIPTGSQAVNGSTLTANIQPSNPEAGPFSYQIVSGPSGLTVDSQGNVQGPASLPFFKQGETQAVVKVGNADHSIEVPLRFSVTDNSRNAPLVRSALIGPSKDKNMFVLDFNNDGSNRILVTDNKNLIFTAKFNGSGYEQDWVFPYALGDGTAIDRILPFDADHDGNYEIAALAKSTLYVIDETHSSIARSIALDGPGQALATADIDNDGHAELIVLVNAAPSSFLLVLDAATLAEEWRTPGLSGLGTDFAVGNVDNDAALELITAGGYVYDGISHLNQWARGSAFGVAILAGDIDGDGIAEIVGFDNQAMGTGITTYSAISKSTLWSIPANTWGFCSVALAQLDGDPAAELLTSVCLNSDISAYDADSSSATLKWTAPQSQFVTSFATGDSNNDGDIDIIWSASGYFSSTSSKLTAYDPNTQTSTGISNGTELLGGFVGAIPVVENGTQQIMFTSRATISNQTGNLFLTLDPTSGLTTQTPLVDNASSSNMLNFCTGNHNGDGNDDILFGTTDYSTVSLESYDFFGQAQLWQHTQSSMYGASTQPPVSCGDFTGDGRTDIAAIRFNTLEIHDPLNQVMLVSTPANSATAIASGDIDGDGKPEIFTASSTTVQKYQSNGSTYVEAGTFIDPSNSFFPMNSLLSLTDIDGDQKPEIVLAKGDYDFNFQPTTRLIVLNSDLSERSRTTIKGQVIGIAPERVRQGHVLVAMMEEGMFYSFTNPRIALIDVRNGNWVWRSPIISGTPSANSLHYDATAANGGSISFGTSAAMYITR